MSAFNSIVMGLVLIVIVFMASYNHGKKQGLLVTIIERASDGDGFITVQGHTVRVGGWIDAEEWNQPYGPEAKAWWKQYEGRVVQMNVTDIQRNDRGERVIAITYDKDGNDLCLALVRDGLAWATRKSPESYRQAMKSAREARRGLWEQDDPMPPWEWRQLEKRG